MVREPRGPAPVAPPPPTHPGGAAGAPHRGALAELLADPTVRQFERTLVAVATVVAAIVLLAIAAAGLPTLVGADSYVVGGASMGTAVRPGSIVVAKRVDPASLEVGDIVTFRRPQNPDVAVTHRVVRIRDEDGVIKLQTQGDANASLDPEEVSTSLPISKMVYTIPYVGYVITFARTSAGKLLLIALPPVVLLADWFVLPSSFGGRTQRPTARAARAVVETDEITALWDHKTLS